MTIDGFIELIEEEFEDLPKGVLTADVPFRDVFQWTSMNALLLMALINTEFDVAIEAEDLKNSTTIRDIFNTILKKRE